ncbi:MAG: class I SAM-dependent methyltransferase [Thermoleophilia bacterium]|jgi:2-polyprenyl-3-methyl-5-hydroxy-6-metoxy-1,4-benzoquinol methylase
MSSHIYDRPEEIDITNTGDSLALIARQIKKGSEVLELGVATGYFSRYLSQVLGCQVDGVELDAVMAREAKPWCRRLLVADLDKIRLADHFSPAAYDAVICADVLEHLAGPEDVLEQLKGLLKPGGLVVMSIPNIAYAGQVLSLMAGEFEYRSEGILDRTHRRFYTRQSLLKMIDEAGYDLLGVEPVHLPLQQSEFFEKLDHLVLPLAGYLLSRADADAYQYVLAARPRT